MFKSADPRSLVSGPACEVCAFFVHHFIYGIYMIYIVYIYMVYIYIYMEQGESEGDRGSGAGGWGGVKKKSLFILLQRHYVLPQKGHQ